MGQFPGLSHDGAQNLYPAQTSHRPDRPLVSRMQDSAVYNYVGMPHRLCSWDILVSSRHIGYLLSASITDSHSDAVNYCLPYLLDYW